MRRASMLFFCVCWIVAVASLGLRAGYPSAQPQAPAPGGQGVGRRQERRRRSPSRRSSSSTASPATTSAPRPAGCRSTGIDPAAAAGHAESGKRWSLKLRGGMMPPQGMPRPDEATLDAFVASLETALDAQALTAPGPGPQAGPPAEPHRVRQRRPRPARPGDRRRRAAAGRRREPRVRQHRRRAARLAVAARAVPGGGAQDQQPGGRHRHRRRRGSPIACRRTTRRRTTSTACRSARAAACSSATTSRRTPSTSSASSCCATSSAT